MIFHAPSLAGTGLAVQHLGFRADERRRVSARAAKICVVLRGSIDTYVGGIARPSDVVFHPAQRPIRINTGTTGASTLSIDIGAAGAERLADVGLNLQDARRIHCPDALVLAHRMRQELAHRDKWTPLVLESLALQLMVLIFRKDERLLKLPAWLRRVQERIATDCHSRSRLSDYASEAGVHPMHLARAFRQHLGVSVGEQIRQERIKRAAVLLSSTDESLADVAAAVGFCDQGHLSRTFKDIMGTSPSAYRRARRLGAQE